MKYLVVLLSSLVLTGILWATGDGNRVSETAGGKTTNYLGDTLNPTGYAQVADDMKGGHVIRSYNWGLQLISQRRLFEMPILKTCVRVRYQVRQ